MKLIKYDYVNKTRCYNPPPEGPTERTPGTQGTYTDVR